MPAIEGVTADPWQAWVNELIKVVFPAGLGPNQRFAAGQTTLVLDFANADPEITNAEVFRVGNTVPADSPNFAPAGQLFDAYKTFLSALPSGVATDQAANASAAGAQVQNEFTMTAKVGSLAPPGSQPVTIGGPSPPLPSGLKSVFLPAFQLDSGFRQKYGEWQALSVAGNTTAGGTITVSSRVSPQVSAPAAKAPVTAGSGAEEGVAEFAFFRFIKSALLVSPLNSATTPLAINVAKAAPPEFSHTNLQQDALENEPPTSFAAANSAVAFTLEVSFTGLGTFSISPGLWWSEAAIRLFQSKLSQPDRDVFFGNNGILERQIFQVVIGFEPTLTLRFEDQAVFNSARDSFKNPLGDGVGIGPFNVNSQALVPGGVCKYSAANNTITIGPIKSSVPILLGVVSIETLPPSSGIISVKNSGGFVATFSVQYVQSGETRTEESGDFPLWVAKTLQLPADATDVVVTVKIATFIKTWSVVATYRYDKPVTKSFELSGTTWSPVIKEI